MKNPFDPSKEPDKFSFFQEMTQSIDAWMISKYPEFDTKLTNKIRYLERIQEEINTQFHNHKAAVLKERQEILEYFRSELDKHMAERFPDISNKLYKQVCDLNDLIKKQEKQAEIVNIKLKKVVESSTLCEDVYKLRDEFKDIKKYFETFSKKMKKVFDI